MMYFDDDTSAKRATHARPESEGRACAGFPSPADDYLELPLDLNEHLIANHVATFFVRVSGDSMDAEGIHHGDLLIVDRSISEAEGRVVVAAVDGEMLVKRFHRRNGCVVLETANKEYPAIVIGEERDFFIWGIVTYVIHSV